MVYIIVSNIKSYNRYIIMRKLDFSGVLIEDNVFFNLYLLPDSFELLASLISYPLVIVFISPTNGWSSRASTCQGGLGRRGGPGSASRSSFLWWRNWSSHPLWMNSSILSCSWIHSFVLWPGYGGAVFISFSKLRAIVLLFASIFVPSGHVEGHTC